MDPLTRRSATLATVIHACLVALAFMPRGCSEIPDPTPPPVAEQWGDPPQAEEISAHAPYGALIAAPLTTSAPEALPTLSAADQPPLPDFGQLVSSVRQDHAGKEVLRGGDKTGIAITDLPTLSANPDDLIAGLQRGAISNETLNREQRMLGTAQEFLHGRLQGQIDRHWRHLLKQVTQPRLIIEVRVDRTGRPTIAHLVNSTGSLTLDRLIEEWLHGPDLNLPPITPDVLYPFLIVIRR